MCMYQYLLTNSPGAINADVTAVQTIIVMKNIDRVKSAMQCSPDIAAFVVEKEVVSKYKF